MEVFYGWGWDDIPVLPLGTGINTFGSNVNRLILVFLAPQMFRLKVIMISHIVILCGLLFKELLCSKNL